LSGEEMALRPSPPLRTVRESLPSYGSSSQKVFRIKKDRL